MDRSLPSGLDDTFLWSSRKGMGWHTRPAMLYGGEYFAHYQKLDETKMGALLTKARCELVDKYMPDHYAVDIGIGGGRFVTEHGGDGYDVCEDAIKWLGDSFVDPYKTSVYAATCWDSLEHIPEPEKLLAQVENWLFVSLPTCESEAEWLNSRHLKPGEHIFYWSIEGFVRWCGEQGFECVEINHVETELGREGITSFAFKRVA